MNVFTMSEKKGKKRSKSYYIKSAHGGKKAKHVNDLDVGMAGFLVTCNKYERETVREMYNLLNEYADKLYGSEKPEKTDNSDNESSDEDMEKAMQKEAAEMKTIKKEVRRFQNTDTKTKNLIFIRTTLENPCELAHVMLTDIFESQVQKARYALRMLPVSITCKANVNQITEAAKTLFKQDFETAFGVGLKFTSVCKIRNNNSVSRTSILPCLGKIIQELNPLHTLCHDEPDVVIIVEVIRNICCLSVVKDYFKFKKYNLHEIVSKTALTGDKFMDKQSKVADTTPDSKGNELESNSVSMTEATGAVVDDKSKVEVSNISENVPEKEKIDLPAVDGTKQIEAKIEPENLANNEDNVTVTKSKDEVEGADIMLEEKKENLQNPCGIESNGEVVTTNTDK